MTTATKTRKRKKPAYPFETRFDADIGRFTRDNLPEENELLRSIDQMLEAFDRLCDEEPHVILWTIRYNLHFGADMVHNNLYALLTRKSIEAKLAAGTWMPAQAEQALRQLTEEQRPLAKIKHEIETAKDVYSYYTDNLPPCTQVVAIRHFHRVDEIGEKVQQIHQGAAKKRCPCGLCDGIENLCCNMLDIAIPIIADLVNDGVIQ